MAATRSFPFRSFTHRKRNGDDSGRDASVTSAPFRFGPTEARRGVVVVHGFTGTPYEVRLLGELLAARGAAASPNGTGAVAQDGIAVVGPTLAGHASTLGALATSRWPDWFASVEAAFLELKSRCDRVAVVGLSLGGLLTLELARRRPAEVAAIASLAAPLWLSPWAERGIRAVNRFRLLRRAALPKLVGSDILDKEMRRKNPCSPAMPLQPLESLVDLMEHLRAPGRLAEIVAPALLAHAVLDHTAPFACMAAIGDALGSTEVKKLELARSFHVITLDVERELLFDAVATHVLAHL